jgi:hypothetical protein
MTPRPELCSKRSQGFLARDRLLIGGQWVKSASGKIDADPATEAHLAKVAGGGRRISTGQSGGAQGVSREW